VTRLIFAGLALYILPIKGITQQWSLTSDASIMRNLSPHQKFWAFGQTIQGQFHFTSKESMYIWMSYYSPGKFSNHFSAIAKSAGTTPQLQDYIVHGTWRPRQISVGWKHYLKGSFDQESGWSLYGTAGFGLMVSKVENVFSINVDTANYTYPAYPVNGNNSFRRLTFDLGLGVEYVLGSDIYLYSDVRTWVSASDAPPSVYFHDTKNVPMPVIVSIGIRLLFGSGID
jgi:hypothetical protein